MSPRLPARVRQLPERVRMAAALEALNETDRLVLTLCLIEGLTLLEAAGALQLTVREAERRMTTAMEALTLEMGVRTTLRRAA
ncbi:MAG: sigma factor-like helix-turn-helix DNA-binding protein [Candidatus Eisenbacteria bacterium]